MINQLKILFLQMSPCIRNYKYAKALKKAGHIVDLYYTDKSLSERYHGLPDEVYNRSIKIDNVSQLLEISKYYDVIHSHNEPDTLTVAALACNCPVIHDTHDLISLRDINDPNVSNYEGIANRRSNGRIYSTQYQKQLAYELYNVQGSSEVIMNYISEDDKPQHFLPKLSGKDGRLHIVYEGGIGGPEHRRFEKIFIDLANRGIYIHIYPDIYRKNIADIFSHYPSIYYYDPISPTILMEKMTQYDFGIIPWNLTCKNKQFLDSTIANKLFEYLAAGLPVFTSDVVSYKQYFEENQYGLIFDDADDLVRKIPILQEIASKINFSNMIFSYEQQVEKLIDYYNLVINNYQKKAFIPVNKSIINQSVSSGSVKFTICIFTYNRAQFLKESIQSAIKQTYDNYEIVIVDDGSTDNTREVVNSFNCSKIRYYYKDHSGAPESRNLVIEKATGDFLLWFGDDDILNEDILKVYSDYLSVYNDVDILYSYLELEFINGEKKIKTSPDWYKKNTEFKKYILFNSGIPDVSSLVKKKVYVEIGGYNPKFLRAQDVEFWARVSIANNYNMKLVPLPLVTYRYHDQGQISGDLVDKDRRYNCVITNFLIQNIKLIELFPDLDINNKKNVADIYNLFAKRFMDLNSYVDAIEWLKKSLSLYYDMEIKSSIDKLQIDIDIVMKKYNYLCTESNTEADKEKAKKLERFFMPFNNLSVLPLSYEIIKKEKSSFISICIPTYNRAAYLAEAIQSALNQTYDNYEIVIVDDGSTDNTEEIVNNFQSNKIRYIKKRNEGRPKTRNKLISEAKGDFLLWLDDDDILYPNILKIYSNILENDQNVDVIYCDIEVYSDNLQKIIQHYKAVDYTKNEVKILENLIIKSGITFGGSIIRKRTIKEVGCFDEEFLRAQDNELWSRLAKKAKFFKVNQVLYKARSHDNNISSHNHLYVDQSYESLVIKNILANNSLREIFHSINWSNHDASVQAYYYIAKGFFRFSDYHSCKRALELISYIDFTETFLLYLYALIGLSEFEKAKEYININNTKLSQKDREALCFVVNNLLLVYNNLLNNESLSLEAVDFILKIKQYLTFYPSVFYFYQASNSKYHDERFKYYLKACITSPEDQCLKKKSDFFINDKKNEMELFNSIDRVLKPITFYENNYLPLISVIIPTYNRLNELKNAIESVLSQTYQNFEILVINDNGDDVSALINSFSDNRIRLFNQKENKGPAAARNVGLLNAKGEYIAYLDDDDLYYPNHLITLIEATKHFPNTKVFYTDAYEHTIDYISDKKATIIKKVKYSIDFSKDLLLQKNISPTLCFFHKRSLVDKYGLFDEKLKTHEDWEYWLRLSLSNNFYHIKEITCEYIRVKNGKSIKTEMLSDFYRTMKIIFDMYPVFNNKQIITERAKRLLEFENILGFNSKVSNEDINCQKKYIKEVVSKQAITSTLREANHLRKIKLSILTENICYARSYLRLLSPISRLLTDSLVEIVDIVYDQQLNVELLNKLDVLIIQKNYPFFISFSLLKASITNPNLKIIYEIDDNLLEHYEGHIGYNKYEANKHLLIECMEKADLVTVSTNKLKEKFIKYNSNITVLPNFIDKKIWTFQNKPKNQKIRILFSGSLTHNIDLKIIIPVINRVLAEFGDIIEVIFWGNYPEGLKMNTNVIFISEFIQDYPQYAQKLIAINADIGLIPLEVNEFNEAKSNIKWLEYSTCQIASICTNILPYSSSIENYKNGLLVNNNFQEWYNAIKTLILDENLRKIIAINSFNTINEHYNVKNEYKLWYNAYYESLKSKYTFDLTQSKINIVLLYDFYGWAWFHRANAIKKNINNDRLNIVVDIRDNANLYKDFDFVVYFGPYWLSKSNLISSSNRIIGSANPFEVRYLEYLVNCNVAVAGIVNSKWQYNYFKQKDNIYYLPNGVDTELFYKIPSPPSDFTVCWVGNPNAYNNKGLDLLTKVTEFLGIKLLTSCIDTKQNLSKNMTHEQLRDNIYHQASCYVCLSDFEGTPNPGLEALSCGLPVISTKVGNMQDIIIDNFNGFLIDKNIDSLINAIKKLQSLNWLTLSHNARNSVLNGWKWSDQAKKYEEMFLKLYSDKQNISSIQYFDSKSLLQLDKMFHVEFNIKEHEKSTLKCEWNRDIYSFNNENFKSMIHKNNYLSSSNSTLIKMSTNKLLFVCHDFPPYKFAGAQLYAYYLAKSLQNMDYQVDIFYPVYESQREISYEKELFSIHKKHYNGLDVYEITVPDQYRTSNDEFDNVDIQNAFYKFLKNSDYDIVHYHLLFRLSARLPLVTKELGIKTVATLHDYWLMCVRGHMIDSQYQECSGPETFEKCSQCQFGKVDQGTCRFFSERNEVTHKGYAAIDYKISPSGFLAEMHSRYSFEKPNILPLGWMTYEKQNRYVDKDTIVFAYLGQIISRKGLDILLNAVNEIESKNWKLLIYGQIYEQWYYDSFKDFIDKHPNIEYCGAYSNDNMGHIFNSFDVFIMPSRRENYPLTLLEALSAGIPSIASDVGGVREMMQDRVEGFVFENGNSKQLSNIMKSFIKNPELVCHLKKNIKPVKTIDDNAKEMEIVYKSLLKK